MLDLVTDILPLTEFKRNTASLLKRLKKSGQPLVLTINGKAEIVVHGAQSYQDLLAAIERAEAIQDIRRGLESFKKGKGTALAHADERIRRKHGIPR